MNHGLLRMLLKKHSYKEGDLVLESGKSSDFYIDCKRMFLSGPALSVCAEEMTRRSCYYEPDCIAGEGVGGIPHWPEVCPDFVNRTETVKVRNARERH